MVVEVLLLTSKLCFEAHTGLAVAATFVIQLLLYSFSFVNWVFVTWDY